MLKGSGENGRGENQKGKRRENNNHLPYDPAVLRSTASCAILCKDPKELDERHIRGYMLHLIDRKQASKAYLDQAVSAIKFLYDCALNVPKAVGRLPRSRKQKKLPIVLGREDMI